VTVMTRNRRAGRRPVAALATTPHRLERKEDMEDHLTPAERDMVKSLNEIGGLSTIEERLLAIVERLDVKLKRAAVEKQPPL
jgi:hypothetical protein